MNKYLSKKRFLGLAGVSIICACTYVNMKSNGFHVAPTLNKVVICSKKKTNDEKISCGLVDYLVFKTGGIYITTTGTISNIVMQISV